MTASDIDTDGVTDLAVVENGLVEIFSGFLLNTGQVTARDRLGDPNTNPSGNGLLIFGAFQFLLHLLGLTLILFLI